MALTHEESVQKLLGLRSEVDGLVAKFNDAYQNGRFDESVKLNKQIEEKVNEYTSVARDDCFETCKASEDPMLAAVTMLSFVTIAVKDKEEGDDKIPVREVIEKERQIDLLKLHKYCGEKGIGADPKWVSMIEQFNLRMTLKAAKSLGIDAKAINDSYAMSNIAREIDLGKDPVSNTTMLKTLQSIVAAMIGDQYKANSHDVAFINTVYAKKNRKALTITVANHKTLRGLMAEVCHRIVTGKAYDLDYKKAKNQ